MVAQFHTEEAAAKLSAQDSLPRSVPMPVQIPVTQSGRPPFTGAGGPSSRKRKKQSDITESFHNEFRQMADAMIARMFYTGGIRFNLARNPIYRASYNFVANNDMGGYVPPGVNKLRTTLLQQEKQNVEQLLQPLKSTWGVKGVTIASDGWSDSQRRPLINFIAVTENGSMFLKCENSEGKVKSKEYIADLLIQVIETIGPN